MTRPRMQITRTLGILLTHLPALSTRTLRLALLRGHCANRFTLIHATADPISDTIYVTASCDTFTDALFTTLIS